MEKHSISAQWRAWLATGRLANIPTVWSNVIVGFFLAGAIGNQLPISHTAPTHHSSLLIVTCLIASMIYIAGCLLGDAVDINFDRKNRPARPLPQGILSLKTVKITAYSLFALSLIAVICLPFILQPDSSRIQPITPNSALCYGSLLMTCVITYALYHKRLGKRAVFLMAACRFMLVLFGISVAHSASSFYNTDVSSHTIGLSLIGPDSWMILIAAAVGSYTLLLSWVASTESDSRVFQKRTLLGALLLTVPLLAFALQKVIYSMPAAASSLNSSDIIASFENSAPAWPLFYAALAAIYAWLLYTLYGLRESKPTFVSRALAGFSLLDAVMIAPFFPSAAWGCVGLFILALLLQRQAPAT